MLTFKQFISADPDSLFLNEEKNTHMTHWEDLVLDGGNDGILLAINYLKELRDTFSGHATRPIDITVKWDGAPAVFCGIAPDDGKFFVAKKGIFAKTPKVYKTPQDIDDDIPSAELNAKMKVALSELSKLGIKKGVYQGDMMFTKGDLKTETIDGEKYVIFHPNTIAYAVPADSELADKIKRADIGVVFHTMYTGDSYENMKANYKVDIGKFRDVPNVWYDNADFKDVSGKATLTKAETSQLNKSLANADKIHQKLDRGMLEVIANSKINLYINTYNNLAVRERRTITNTKKHAEGFKDYIMQKYQVMIDKLKSEKGKNRKIEERDALIDSFFGKWDMKKLAMVFDLQNYIKEAKLLLIKKMNTVDGMSTFLKTKDGFKVTGSEGFVAIDRLSGGSVKLVDRMEFSYANFSDEIVKGWQK